MYAGNPLDDGRLGSKNAALGVVTVDDIIAAVFRDVTVSVFTSNAFDR